MTKSYGLRMSEGALATWRAMGAGAFVSVGFASLASAAPGTPPATSATAAPAAAPTSAPSSAAPAGSGVAAVTTDPAPTASSSAADPAAVPSGPVEVVNEPAPSAVEPTAVEPVAVVEPTEEASEPNEATLTKPPVFLSFGYIASFVTGPNPAIGHGAEVSLISFLDSNDLVGIGPVLQYQSYGSPQHGRLGAGVGASFFLGGLDLLYSYRESAPDHDGTHGLTVGPFLTFFGIVHAAGRFTMALSPSSEAGWGNEYGLTLGLKLPLLVAGDFWNVGHGRPLLVDGRAVTASLQPVYAPCASALSLASGSSTSGSSTSSTSASPTSASLAPASVTLLLSVGSLGAAERAALGEFWCRVAEEEYASIAAFNALSLRLLAQGAPAELHLRCQQAARDEIRHAALARELAQTFTSRQLRFEALPSALGVALNESVPQLALAALVEGCVAEGAAAEVLALAAQEAHSAELRAVLLSMASDENAHAELAWAIVEYCLEREPEAVRDVLLSWLCEAPPALSAQASESPPLPRGYGAVARANQQTLSYGTWANTTLRLHVALGLDALAA